MVDFQTTTNSFQSSPSNRKADSPGAETGRGVPIRQLPPHHQQVRQSRVHLVHLHLRTQLLIWYMIAFVIFIWSAYIMIYCNLVFFFQWRVSVLSGKYRYMIYCNLVFFFQWRDSVLPGKSPRTNHNTSNIWKTCKLIFQSKCRRLLAIICIRFLVNHCLCKPLSNKQVSVYLCLFTTFQILLQYT